MKKHRPRRSRNEHLGCESLEDRRLLAVMVATEAALRAAVLSPVADPDVVMTGDITLTTGELLIAETVNLDGGGFTLTQQLAGARVINVDDSDMYVNSFAASIDDITITGGYTSYGAGIRNVEDLTITNSTITGNRAVDPGMTYTGNGGGIATQGNLTMSDSYVTGNTAGSLIDLPTTGGGFYLTGVGGGIATGAYAQLNLDNVRVDNNNAANYGGGLEIDGIGPHVITNSTFDNNRVGNTADYPSTVGINGSGGGVWADAGPGAPGLDLTITNSSASNNEFGGSSTPGNVTFDYGGGLSITTRGTSDAVALDNVTVSGNTSTSDGISAGYVTVQRGGGIELTAIEGGTFDVSNSTISGNSLSPLGSFYNYGGGISFATFDTGAGFAYPGYFNVTNSTISNNYAGRGAGWGIRYQGGYGNDGIGAQSEVRIDNATVTGNSVGASGSAGAAHWAWLATNMVIENSNISGNYSASSAGAFFNASSFNDDGFYSTTDLTVRNSSISGNTALTTGGAFYATTSSLTYPNAQLNSVVVENSTVTDNVAFGNGGGFYAYDSNLTIFQSTVSGNTSFGVGGGLNGSVACDVSGGGGPCYTGTPNEALFLIDRATFANNYSGGNGTLAFADNTGFDIDNTLVSGNNPTGGDDLTGGGGTMTPNVLEIDYSCVELDASGNPILAAGTGNVVGSPCGIGPLADNGGPTLTHALLSGSLAIGAATPGGVGPDQRGYTDTDRLDIGSFEYGATPPDTCDLDNDSDCDLDDIDALATEVAAMTNNPAFDLTGDTLVNLADMDRWREIAGAMLLPCGNPFLPADFNLDGSVNGADFVIWNNNKFGPGTWSAGDANGDGTINGQDFVIWNTFKFQDSCVAPSPAATVSQIGQQADSMAQAARTNHLSTSQSKSFDAPRIKLQAINRQLVRRGGSAANATTSAVLIRADDATDTVAKTPAKISASQSTPAAATPLGAWMRSLDSTARSASVEREEAVDSVFEGLASR